MVLKKQQRKALRLGLLSVNDCKRVYTSLYFIITNFHTALKPQIKVSHSVNCPGFSLYYTQCLINHGQLVNHNA